jgi:hypothetical protein
VSGWIWSHPSAILCFGCGGRSLRTKSPGFSKGVFVGGDPVRFNIDTLLNASHMKNLIELETEIKHLPEHEIRQLTERLQVYLDEKWDRQMETDLASGRLDNLIAKAEADIAANHVKNLDEVLHNP